MGVWVCVSSETVWFPTLIGQKQGSLSAHTCRVSLRSTYRRQFKERTRL